MIAVDALCGECGRAIKIAPVQRRICGECRGRVEAADSTPCDCAYCKSVDDRLGSMVRVR
jgi:hypothetical protein